MHLSPRYTSASITFDQGYLDCGNAGPLNGFNTFTLEAWVFPTSSSYPSIAMIVSKLDLGVDGAFALYLDNGVPTAWYPVNQTVAGSAPLTANEWHYLAATCDGETLALYVDGKRFATTVSPQTLSSAKDLLIGAAYNQGDPSPYGFFAGQISMVMVWNVVRLPQQLVNDAGNVCTVDPLVELNLVLHLDMAVLPIVDRSGTNSTITPHGGVSTALSTPGLAVSQTGYADCGTGPGLDFPGNASYSIASWVYPTAPGPFVAKGSPPQYALTWDGSRFATWRNSLGLPSQPVMTADQWYHVATTYEGKTGAMSLYVDGNLQSAAYFPIAVATTASDPLLVGRDEHGSTFGGYVQNVRVMSGALTQAEVCQWMYNDPVYGSHIAGGFDFGVSPPVDTTGNDTITLSGTAQVTSLSAPLAADDPRIVLGVPLLSNAVYLNQFEEEAIVVLPAPLVVGPQIPPLTEEHKAALWKAFAAQHAGADKETLARYRAFFDQEYERARTMIETRPELLKVFTRETRHGVTRVTYHGPRGDCLVWEGAADSMDDCTSWWIGFTFALTVGFFQALGILPGTGDIATRIFRLLTANKYVLAAISSAVEGTINADVALGIIKVIGEQHLIWPLIKLVLTQAGWLTLFWFLLLIIKILTGMEEAQALAGMTTWAIQLSHQASQYQKDCGGAKGGLRLGAERVAQA